MISDYNLGEPVEILLVEDDPADAELTQRVLARKRLVNNLLWVKDGAEALDFLFARGAFAGRVPHRPGLVLLDLKLPKVDGVEVLRAIRSHATTRTLPVVVLTSSDEERDLVATYELGVNSYLRKPVAFADFQRLVEDLSMYWLLLNRTPADSGPPRPAASGEQVQRP